MRTGRPTLTMSSDERTHLLAIARSRSLPAALTLRAKIVLACARERVGTATPSWRRGLASAPIRSANGAIASSPIGSLLAKTPCSETLLSSETGRRGRRRCKRRGPRPRRSSNHARKEPC